jgi:hypothetical protein
VVQWPPTAVLRYSMYQSLPRPRRMQTHVVWPLDWLPWKHEGGASTTQCNAEPKGVKGRPGALGSNRRRALLVKSRHEVDCSAEAVGR